MKTYYFSSQLSKAELQNKVRNRAAEMGKGWRWRGDQLLYKFDETGIILVKTLSCGAIGGQCVFRGKLWEQDGHAIIQGSFGPAPEAARGLFIFYGALLLLATPLLKWAVLFMLPLGAALMRVVFWEWAPLWEKRPRNDVLNFIQSELLE